MTAPSSGKLASCSAVCKRIPADAGSREVYDGDVVVRDNERPLLQPTLGACIPRSGLRRCLRSTRLHRRQERLGQPGLLPPVRAPLAAANPVAPGTTRPGAPLDHFGVTAAHNVAFEHYVIPLPARFLAKGPAFGAARAGFTTRQPRSRSIISA